jgi:hypothetical protein
LEESDRTAIEDYLKRSLELDNGDHRDKKPSLSFACLYYEGFTDFELNYDVLKQCHFNYNLALFFLLEMKKDQSSTGSVAE